MEINNIYKGKLEKRIKELENNSVDSVVTDPPYGLGKEPDPVKVMQDWAEKGYSEVKGKGFMGKEWDGFVPQPATWKEVYRVLKPGGFILCFSGTRTADWMGMALRFAGFRYYDTVAWTFGSGFPKNHNIGKAVDKLQRNEREKVSSYRTGEGANFKYSGDGKEQLHEAEAKEIEITKGNSEWEGYGTALKPAWENIILAQKPIEKGLSIAQNCLKWGTGGLNIDESRIPSEEDLGRKVTPQKEKTSYSMHDKEDYYDNSKGKRFPANLIHDGSDEVEEGFPYTKSGNLSQRHKEGSSKVFNRKGGGEITENYGCDSGSASRFFYCAKANKKERNKYMNEGNINTHPTVKPIELMKYLVKLITPKNGIVLDPFAGSGTTAISAYEQGYNFIAIEKGKEEDNDEGNCSYDTAKERIDNMIEQYND